MVDKLAQVVVVAQAERHHVRADEVHVVRVVGPELCLVADVGVGGVRALEVEHHVVQRATAAAGERAGVVVERNLRTRDNEEEKRSKQKTQKVESSKGHSARSFNAQCTLIQAI